MLQKHILWQEPVFSEEVGEYFENLFTKREFQKMGLIFDDVQDLTDFMLKNGKMLSVTRKELAKRPKNLTLCLSDFKNELRDVEYSRGYRRLEEALEIGCLKLPVPIIFDFGQFYYGFAGNRRTNLAFNNGLDLKVWMVCVKSA